MDVMDTAIWCAPVLLQAVRLADKLPPSNVLQRPKTSNLAEDVTEPQTLSAEADEPGHQTAVYRRK